MIFVVLTLAVIILGVLYIKKKYSYFDEIGVKQYSPNWFFGSLKDHVLERRSLVEIIQEQYVAFKHERYFGLYQFFLPTLVVNDLNLIKDITVKHFDHFTDHEGNGSDDLDPLWSRNVFSMRGEAWHNMRVTLTPAFTGNKMRFMFPLINEVAEDFIKYFLKENRYAASLDMKDTFGRATNDMIASTAFGIRCDSLGDPNNEFYLKGRKAFDFSGLRKMAFFMYSAVPALAKLLGVRIFTEEISTFFRGVIKDAITTREEKGIVRPDMVHLLLQARKGQLQSEKEIDGDESFASTKEYSTSTSSSMKAALEITNEDITAQALVFYFAGFDTTSYMLSFMAYELAINPDIQRRLIDEVDEAVEEGNGKVTYDALMKMKYLDMVTTETLRKWPLVVALDRLCTKDFIIEPKRSHEKPIHLKKGSVTWFPVFGIHRDPSVYPDPEKFDPERFSSENKSKINPFAYMPFGIGPRNCIGSRLALMNAKTMIANILTTFEFVPVKETAIPLVICKKHVNLAADGGIWLGFKKR